MNILFVCSANKLRSKTADDYFTLKYPNTSFMSAGTNHKTCMKKGTTILEEWMLEWADKVFVMENRHKSEIVKHTGSQYNKKITILYIPDDYDYYQKELIEIFESRLDFNELS